MPWRAVAYVRVERRNGKICSFCGRVGEVIEVSVKEINAAGSYIWLCRECLGKLIDCIIPVLNGSTDVKVHGVLWLVKRAYPDLEVEKIREITDPEDLERTIIEVASDPE